jgi:hypothetical protein
MNVPVLTVRVTIPIGTVLVPTIYPVGGPKLCFSDPKKSQSIPTGLWSQNARLFLSDADPHESTLDPDPGF